MVADSAPATDAVPLAPADMREVRSPSPPPALAGGIPTPPVATISPMSPQMPSSPQSPTMLPALTKPGGPSTLPDVVDSPTMPPCAPSRQGAPTRFADAPKPPTLPLPLPGAASKPGEHLLDDVPQTPQSPQLPSPPPEPAQPPPVSIPVEGSRSPSPRLSPRVSPRASSLPVEPSADFSRSPTPSRTRSLPGPSTAVAPDVPLEGTAPAPRASSPSVEAVPTAQPSAPPRRSCQFRARAGMHFAVIRGVIGFIKEEWSGVVSDESLAHLATVGAPPGSSTYYVAAKDHAAAQAIVQSEMCPSQVSVHGPPGRLPSLGDVVVYTDGACKTLGEGKLSGVQPPPSSEWDALGIVPRMVERRHRHHSSKPPGRTPSPGAPASRTVTTRPVVDVAGWGIWFGEGCALNTHGPLEGRMQTAGRAELRAVISAVETVNAEIPHARHVIVRTDCRDVVNVRALVTEGLKSSSPIAGAPAPDASETNVFGDKCDLKLRLGAALRQLDERKVELSVEWVKGHGISYGNHCADWLASEGSLDKAGEIKPNAKRNIPRRPCPAFVARPYIDYSGPRTRGMPLRKVHSGGVSKPVHQKKKRRMHGWQANDEGRDSYAGRGGKRMKGNRHGRPVPPARASRYHIDRDRDPGHTHPGHGLVPVMAGVAHAGGHHAHASGLHVNGISPNPVANGNWIVDQNPASNWNESVAAHWTESPAWTAGQAAGPQFAAFGAPVARPQPHSPTMLDPAGEVIDLVSEAEEEEGEVAARGEAGTVNKDKVVEVISLD